MTHLQQGLRTFSLAWSSSCARLCVKKAALTNRCASVMQRFAQVLLRKKIINFTIPKKYEIVTNRIVFKTSLSKFFSKQMKNKDFQSY